jgi:hypothetical protein
MHMSTHAKATKPLAQPSATPSLPPHPKVEGLPTTFLEPENGHFWRGCIYGRNDDHVRFGFFCGAALEYLRVSGAPGGCAGVFFFRG